mgnify:CR=1 FL=1
MISPSGDREMSFAIRSMLVDAARTSWRRLSIVCGDGEYRLCVECGEPIAPRGFAPYQK